MDLASDSFKTRKAAIEKLARSRDGRLIQFFDDFNKGNIYLWKNQLVLSTDIHKDADGKKIASIADPLTRAPLEIVSIPLSDFKELDVSAKDRLVAREAMTFLRLSDPDPDLRFNAVKSAGDNGSENYIAVLKEILPGETNVRIQKTIHESILLISLNASSLNLQQKIEAINELGRLCSGRALSKLRELEPKSTDPAMKKSIQDAIASIELWQTKVRMIGYIFSGLSLGSILVLLALGLSIIFGVMGVINMAQGELMMIGAYTTYMTQQGFEAAIAKHWLSPGAFEYYIFAAIPLSFLTAAFVGYLIEMFVVRYLYGRPLDTLLATTGVSIVLIQIVRLNFGDNIGVNSPKWLVGGTEIMQDVVLPYNRCFILLFCALCIFLMYMIMDRTKLGLLLRATTQNRGMAASLGVPTRKIDGYTFALGAGLAGLAGCALSQVAGVTPDMGQNYIVESFMVVVTGGVGKLAGAIWAGFGLGCLNKFFEPFIGAVWGKVCILTCVVLFIQRRPSGLFPAKGRTADA